MRVCSMINHFGIAIVLAIATNPTSTVAQWKQDRYAISFWVDPVVPPSQFDAEYAIVANANFTVLLGGFGATDPANVQLQIAAATKAGLAAVPSICGGTCANLSGAWGFQIADEPSASAFPTVAPLVADAKRIGGLAFVNLLPNYATPAQFGTPTYGEYVSEFVKIVKPNILCVDHYPDFDETSASFTNKSKSGYIDNLMVLREATLTAGYPLGFWNFFNAMPYGGASQYDISEADLRWQVFTSLAIGSKGVLYFCYWTPTGSDFTRGQAIMTPTPGSAPDNANQSPGQKYPMVKRINSKLKVLGGYLLERTSSAVVQAAGGRTDTTMLVQTPISSINGSNMGTNWSFMLGFFDNNSTVLLVNQDSNHPALATLEFTPSAISISSGFATTAFDAAGKTMMEINPSTGAAEPALDDSPFLQGFQVSLLGGDARLFAWQ
eukprot:m.65688 g.65688  ORF g.65688 m.65688 type:complete len:437 (+) comp23591_c0_seq1:48-1358(+)